LGFTRVELWWSFWWSSGRAPVDVCIRGLSEDPLKSGAAVRLGKPA
jgi:hypothetical protein